eukprot:FR741977.1.p3 GENE.FR741977.1~~FR741977.1.p3  ORF type:complete len:105 (+),score=10.49 FR741977.1:370-684(+)
MVLGPVAYYWASLLTRQIIPPPAEKDRKADVGFNDPVVRTVRQASIAFVVASVAYLFQAHGPDAALELVTGCVMVSLACMAGESVGALAEEDGGLLSGTWLTHA